MKYTLLLLPLYFTFCSFTCASETNSDKQAIVQILDDGDYSLYHQATLFYKKFCSLELDDIKFCSNHIIGVPQGKFARHSCVDYIYIMEMQNFYGYQKLTLRIK